MSIITTAKDHKFSWYVRLFFWKQRCKYGAVLEPARLWGRSPKVFATLASLYGAFDRGCSFCIGINSAMALKRGITGENMLSKFKAALGVKPQGFCAIAPQPS